VAATLHDRLGAEAPVAGLVLGSGLGGLVRRIEGAQSVPYADIAGFAPPTVEGHAGELIAGRLAERPVLALAGRFHLYEGHSAAASAFPIRVLRALGARVLLLSNAAGGISRALRPGDLMVINDHVNLTWHNPLTGPVVPGDARFPDMSGPWDAGLRSLLHDCARSTGVALADGVYLGLTGPSYETPAEVRMLERLGVDAVGMSTVAEVIVARAIGMRVAGMSCVANLACGLSLEPITHDDVLASIARAARAFEAVTAEFVKRLE
jgi:purine-nucleoside phosphorylase